MKNMFIKLIFGVKWASATEEGHVILRQKFGLVFIQSPTNNFQLLFNHLILLFSFFLATSIRYLQIESCNARFCTL